MKISQSNLGPYIKEDIRYNILFESSDLPVPQIPKDAKDSQKKKIRDKFEKDKKSLLKKEGFVYSPLSEEEKNKINYLNCRKLSYQTSNLTNEDLIIALWEMVVENRPEKAQELQEKRNTIKEKYPKA